MATAGTEDIELEPSGEPFIARERTPSPLGQHEQRSCTDGIKDKMLIFFGLTDDVDGERRQKMVARTNHMFNRQNIWETDNMGDGFRYRGDFCDEFFHDLDRGNDHRPFFTLWVTGVQIICFIVSVSVYGIAPFGYTVKSIHGQVLMSSLSVEDVSYMEPENMWVGPRQADLIHLGAKFSPCMRRDTNVINAIDAAMTAENGSACCIANDGGGCIQATKDKCSDTLSTWFKWGPSNPGPDGRTSGSVCGQDPRLCEDPQSLKPFEWPDSIVNWPICKSKQEFTGSTPATKHMTCAMVGRPCCVGIQGQCVIATKEYCDFRRGYFHAEATLCSQVDCMNEICGMTAFWTRDKPDQVYRLWTSLFIHAGLFQLLISVIFQGVIMYRLEKMIGWLRVCIVYVFSGIAGSFGSAIFLPYFVEAGPSGSHLGIIACLLASMIEERENIENKCFWFSIVGSTIFTLFAVGFLPFFDNWSHLFGFLVGFPLSFAVLPDVWLGLEDKSIFIRGAASLSCLLGCAAVLVVLVILFYVAPIYTCPGCQYFTCIPFTETFCSSYEVKITHHDI